MRQVENKIDNTSPSTTGRLSAAEFNALQTEAEEAARTSGIALDTGDTDSDLQMLAQSMARYASGGVYGNDYGAVNAYVVQTPGEFIMPKAYFKGLRCRWWPRNTNTDESTLNAWALGNKALLDEDGEPLVGGEVVEGRMAEADYDPALLSGVGAWKLAPWSNNLIVDQGAGGELPDDGGSGIGDGTLKPCLVGITGDITGLLNCGEAIASSQQSNNLRKENPYDNTNSTGWSPPNGTPPTAEWIGWDFDPTDLGHVGTIDQATFVQRFNASNRNDIWLAVNVEASEDLVNWVVIGVFTSCTHPAPDSTGAPESTTFPAYTARAFRLRPTSVARYTSATILTQSASIREVQFIKS